MARPRIYSEAILEKAKAYLSTCGVFYKQIVIGDGETATMKTITEVNLPSIEGFSLFIGVSRALVYEWDKATIPETKELLYPEFVDIINEVREKQAQMLINNGVAGTFNPVISKVLLTKHGYREGIDQTTNDKELPTPLLNALPNNDSNKEDSSAA